MFNGDFRTKPTITHRGSSQVRYGKDVIADNRRQRETRATERHRVEAAVKIQRHIRGFVDRCQLKKTLRTKYDSDYNNSDVCQLASYLCRFYDSTVDHSRLSNFLSHPLIGRLYENDFLRSNILLVCLEDLYFRTSGSAVISDPVLTYVRNAVNNKTFCRADVLSSSSRQTIRIYRMLISLIDSFIYLGQPEPSLHVIFHVLTEKYYFLLPDTLILTTKLKCQRKVISHLSDSFSNYSDSIISTLDYDKVKSYINGNFNQHFSMLVKFLESLSPTTLVKSLSVIFRTLDLYDLPEFEVEQHNNDSSDDDNSVIKETYNFDYLEPLFHRCESDDEKKLLSLIIYQLITKYRVDIIHCTPIRKLCFNIVYIQWLWMFVNSIQDHGIFVNQDSCMSRLSEQKILTNLQYQLLIPLLTVFSVLFQQFLRTSHDADFIDETFLFKQHDLQKICLLLRNIAVYLNNLDLVALQPRYNTLNLKSAFTTTRYVTVPGSIREDSTLMMLTVNSWIDCYSGLVDVLRELHSRDCRVDIFPSKDVWLWNQPIKSIDRTNIKVFIDPLSVTNLNLITIKELYILQHMPYIVSFNSRVSIFHDVVDEDRLPYSHVWGQSSENIILASIRRDYIYEDAYAQLTESVASNLKKKIVVKLINYTGLDEAGVDGGGLFREFLTTFLKEAFNPHRGLFIETDGLLHPNPSSSHLYADYHKHYFFIGRLLAKAIYEKLLVDIPLAPFFLHKLIGCVADINLLRSLDPDMYRNMLELRNYDDDTLRDLCLSFIVSDNVFGDNKTIELKPDGANIAVTKSNLIEYIHMMADYRLNRQIRIPFRYFAEGFYSVISPTWIKMFNYSEFQCLLSGSTGNVDIEDLKQNTVYHGGYSEDHPTIKLFWEVVESMTPEEHRKLLSFVTSSNRTPLLGFRSLNPLFGIHSAGTDDRLPTSSTCMNLLKLPEFSDKSLLRKRLEYVIHSGAGFELS